MRALGGQLGPLTFVLVLVAASLVPATVYWATTRSETSPSHSMTPFTSLDALHRYILTYSCNSTENRGFYNPGTAPQRASPSTGQTVTADYAGSATATVAPSHSETNAQVAGVDELDNMKNDGTYIYTITNNTVAIVLAYPVSAAKLVARLSVNGSLQGIFVEGNSLVVVSQPYEYYPGPIVFMGVSQPATGLAIAGSATTWYPIAYPQTTSVWVFDISDHSKPVLTTTLVMNGTLAGARLIQSNAYFIATQPVYCNGPGPVPLNVVNGRPVPILANQIYHSDIVDSANSFTTVVGIDLSQSSPTPTAKTFLIGTSSNIYVSTDRIYLTQQTWGENEETAVHKISISRSNINYEATGTVPGHVLNQFSMDEYNGYFRVATTNYRYTLVRTGTATYLSGSQQQTNLYVLDGSLHVTGKLEGLSLGEAFYAARFMGDRAYLVTYQRMDPLFVIGLQDPTHPQVLGQLSITGVSDYLQPYDENHLIGLGKSSTNVTWENAALFQGLKLSLFDVSDPNHPIDTSNFLAGGRGSDSPALTDHRAVLFDQSLNLLVIPVEIVPQQNSTYAWAYNPPVWQGAYVFSVTANGIVFRGGITHLPNSETPSYTNSNLDITRALYIGGVLYTISTGMVKMNSLSDLTELGSVLLE